MELLQGIKKGTNEGKGEEKKEEVKGLLEKYGSIPRSGIDISGRGGP